jgi:hypothetical protein
VVLSSGAHGSIYLLCLTVLVAHMAAAVDIRPPINFFYSHFHDSIRAELDVLDASVSSLEPANDEQDLITRLKDLKSRYRFLEQIYKYHSNVEDEVRLLATGPQRRCCCRRLTSPGCALACMHDACAVMQVVYPALDAKVKNVTVAYTVEHQDEVRATTLGHGAIAVSTWLLLYATTYISMFSCANSPLCP